jgi:hypothetical protein
MSRNASVGDVAETTMKKTLTYLLCCDDHRCHGRDCDGCLRPLAGGGVGWARMGWRGGGWGPGAAAGVVGGP